MSPIDAVVSDSDSEYDSDSESEYDDDECQGCIYKETGCFIHHAYHCERLFELTSYFDNQDWCADCMSTEGSCVIEKCNINHALPTTRWFSNKVCTVIS